MTRLFSTVLATFGLLLWISSSSTAQEPPEPSQEGLPESDVTLVLEGEARPPIRLAFPEVEGLGNLRGPVGAGAREMEETLRNDLEISRYFEIQGPWAFTVLELTGERDRDFEQYRSLGNEYLLRTNVADDAGQLVLEGRLFDLAGGTPILAKRYRAKPSVARRMAHTFADEIIRSLTGRASVALTSIAFTSDRTGFKEIYLMDYDGADLRRLTGHKSTSMSAAWKPDRSGLAYVSFWSGEPSIYFARVPSGDKSPLVTEGLFNISPGYSPDGRRLVFTRALDGNSEIFVADASGANLQRLTFTGSIDTNAAWSPKGNAIVFTSSRAGNPHLYLMDPDGANVRRLTFEGEYNDGVSWHPEGTMVAYASRRRGVFQIALTNVATLETRLLTTGPGDKEDPTFSPDGRHLAFVTKRGGRKQIFVVDVDGRNLRQVTREGNNESPAWSPWP